MVRHRVTVEPVSAGHSFGAVATCSRCGRQARSARWHDEGRALAAARSHFYETFLPCDEEIAVQVMES